MSHLAPTPGDLVAADATAANAGTAFPRRAEGGADAPAPRRVIRGESSSPPQTTASDSPESPPSENLALYATGNGRAKFVLIPQPKLDGQPDAAITDYLNCTFPFEIGTPGLTAWFTELHAVLGDAFTPVTTRTGGLHGYQHSYRLGDSRALFAHGGQRGTALLSLPGEACAQVPDWSRLVTWLRDELGARITRWDGAVDDYEGLHSVDWAVEQYYAGQFGSGGNQPSCSVNGNWHMQDGRGRTFYVGRREHGKYLRVYEKGKQLGDPASPWVRWEIELHNKDRRIPWEVLLEPGRYAAGAYPALAWAQAQASRIETAQQAVDIGYAQMLHHARQSYGKFINLMLAVEGSPEAVVAKLRQPGVPSRLHYPVPPGHDPVLPVG